MALRGPFSSGARRGRMHAVTLRVPVQPQVGLAPVQTCPTRPRKCGGVLRSSCGMFVSMSAVATITLLPKSVIPTLRDAATPKKGFLRQSQRQVPCGSSSARSRGRTLPVVRLRPRNAAPDSEEVPEHRHDEVRVRRPDELALEDARRDRVRADTGHKKWLPELDPGSSPSTNFEIASTSSTRRASPARDGGCSTAWPSSRTQCRN